MMYGSSSSVPVFGLRREIDRLFEDTFGRGDGTSSWSPAVDVREIGNELRLDIELPGISPEEVEVTAENGTLTIRGEKRAERKEGDEKSRYHVVERSYGAFSRSFQLPAGLDDSRIEATCENGILSIHIPRTALPQPRRIEIGGTRTGQQETVRGGERQTSASGRSQSPSTDGGTAERSMAASGSQRPASSGSRARETSEPKG